MAIPSVSIDPTLALEEGTRLFELGRYRLAAARLMCAHEAGMNCQAPLMASLFILSDFDTAIDVVADLPGASGDALRAEAWLYAGARGAPEDRETNLQHLDAILGRLERPHIGWVSGLQQLTLGDLSGAARHFSVDQETTQDTWNRCSMLLACAYHDIAHASPETARYTVEHYLDVMLGWDGRHPGQIKPDCYLLALALWEATEQQIDASWFERWEARRDLLIGQGMRVLRSEAAVLEAARITLEAVRTAPQEVATGAATLAQALEDDFLGCMVKEHAALPSVKAMVARLAARRQAP